MGNALKKMIMRTEEPPNELLCAIRDVCRQLDNARLRFEMESDSDLIESAIYEMEALRARYRYLLRRAREEGVTAAGVLQMEERAEKS